MNALLCMIALMSPHRRPENVGRVVSTFEIYRTHNTEYCFEKVKRLGWTWVEDEVLWFHEVDFSFCEEVKR